MNAKCKCIYWREKKIGKEGGRSGNVLLNAFLFDVKEECVV